MVSLVPYSSASLFVVMVALVARHFVFSHLVSLSCGNSFSCSFLMSVLKYVDTAQHCKQKEHCDCERCVTRDGDCERCATCDGDCERCATCDGENDFSQHWSLVCSAD